MGLSCGGAQEPAASTALAGFPTSHGGTCLLQGPCLHLTRLLWTGGTGLQRPGPHREPLQPQSPRVSRAGQLVTHGSPPRSGIRLKAAPEMARGWPE